MQIEDSKGRAEEQVEQLTVSELACDFVALGLSTDCAGFFPALLLDSAAVNQLLPIFGEHAVQCSSPVTESFAKAGVPRPDAAGVAEPSSRFVSLALVAFV